jgi:hypothetical protein
MGQRSQIIVLRKIEKGACDYIRGDKFAKRGAISVQSVYHNQWKYGGGFLQMLVDILGAWNLALKTEKKEKYFRMPSIDEVIQYCNAKEFPNMRGYSDITSEGFKDKKTVEEARKSCNNNNGFIILLVDNDKLSYDIVSGAEDTEVEKRVTAKQYLKLFYKNDDEINKAGITPAYVEKIIANIDAAERFNSFKIKLGEQE